MKKRLLSFLIIPLLVLLLGCSKAEEKQQEITITFIQHTFIRFSYNDNKEINGYYFENDELAKTSFKFSKNHNLLQEEINNFDSTSLNYILPTLSGDGYWSFTFFTSFFDTNSGLSCNFLEPCKLENDLTLHFGIYG